MNERKFMPGDMVKIRRFDEIDADDIGSHRFDASNCFGIDRSHIDSLAGQVFTIESVSRTISYGSYDYKLLDKKGNRISYWWAQGMLDFEFAEELPDPDEEGLFAFLSV